MGIEIYQIDPPGEVLKQYYHDRSRWSFIMGPVGSGKTTASCQKLMRLMTEQAPNAQGERLTRMMAVRNTAGDLANTTIKDWLGLYGGIGEYRVGHSGRPPSQAVEFALKSEKVIRGRTGAFSDSVVKSDIIFQALDRPDSIQHIKGTQITWFLLNEVSELHKAVIDFCDGRTGRYPSDAQGGIKAINDAGEELHGMIGDTNSMDQSSWYYRAAEGPPVDGVTFFRQPGGVIKVDGEWVANPAAENTENLPKNYYKHLMANKSEDFIKTILGNEYGLFIDGMAVYPEYSDSVHCARKPFAPDSSYPVYIGIDFGRTPAAVMAQYIMGQWRVFDELGALQMGAKDFGLLLRRKMLTDHKGLKVAAITGDPSGAAGTQVDDTTPFDVLAAAGIMAEPASTNDALVRREVIHQILRRSGEEGRPGMLVSPKCQMVREGMAGKFMFKTMRVSGDKQYHEKPSKNAWSHFIDALEYCFMGGGEDRLVVDDGQMGHLRRSKNFRVKRAAPPLFA